MNTRIRQLNSGRSPDRIRHARSGRGTNNTLLSETRENDDLIDILSRIFAYIAASSAALIVAVALWTIFVKN